MTQTKISLIKHSFFHNSLKVNDFSFDDDDFNLDLWRNEYSSFYQLFLSNRQLATHNITLLFYLDTLHDLMLCYYQYDYVSSELRTFQKHKKEITALIQKYFLNQKPLLNQFSLSLFEKLKANRHKTPFSLISISKIRKHVGDLNTRRSQFGYSRNLAVHLVTNIQRSFILEWINDLNEFLGNQWSFLDGIILLNASRELLARVGIILYGLRFIINLIILMKHIIQATLTPELSTKKVLKQEIEKRGFTMASDFVWAIVGLLTTYNNFFHISSLIVPPIIISFLIFDSLLLVAQWYYEAVKYQKDVHELKAQITEATPFEQALIQRQIDIIHDEWNAQCAYYAVNILGANILAMSFTMTLLGTNPFFLVSLALFSMIGNALYNSADEFKEYYGAKIMLQRELSNGNILNDEQHEALLKKLREEHRKKCIQFWTTLACNVGGISLILTAAVISWPIALGLTLLYIAYQLNKAYQKQSAKNNINEDPPNIYRLFHAKGTENLTLSDPISTTYL